MKHRSVAALCLSLASLAGCKKEGPGGPAAEAPPTVAVEHAGDVNLIHVENSGLFQLVPAASQQTSDSLTVTGSVTPDISQTIPVISMANGRVLDIHAHLGDYVKKGQLLMEVQSTDVSGAFAGYLKAVNDEHLTKTQLERAKLLYDKGAIPKSQLEVAENAEADNIGDLNATEQQLKILGLDKDHPGAAVKVYAPASGVIISQNVTNSAAAGVGLAGSSTAFTIADLSHVWVICDVFENDLAQVKIGQKADIHLNALPGQTFTGTISDIGAVLDPTIRTAKVRIQVQNPNRVIRVGEFVNASLYGTKAVTHTVVPSTAVLHLQDRDWVYLPTGDGNFHRIEVKTGPILAGNQQEIASGLQPGQQVVGQALSLQNAAAQ